MSHSNPSARLLLVVVVLGVIFSGVFMELAGLRILPNTESVFPDASRTQLAGLALIVIGLVVMGWNIFRKEKTAVRLDWIENWKHKLVAWNIEDDKLSQRQRVFQLFLVSLLGLFFELALIRWLGTEIKVFAYLKNVVLIAAFLGLGIGFFLARHPIALFPIFIPLAILLSGTVALGVAFGLWSNIIIPSSEQLVLLGVSFSNMQSAPLLLRFFTWIPFYVTTFAYFALIAFVFIPLGQYTGKCMRAFAPIPGYSLNLVGSLAGTLLFTVISFAWLPPIIWFGLVALVALFQLRNSPAILRRFSIIATAIFVLVYVLIPSQPGVALWSPYNQLVVSPLTATDKNEAEIPWGYQLSIGEYYYYQDMVDLSPQFFQAHPDLPDVYQHSEYEVPYQFIRPKNVLVLGAGTGNDVSTALRNGAQSIDAVEIDPAILELGKEYHPERSYYSPQVHLITDDARAYIKRTDQTYDLVLFGLLDSYQVISAFGAVRLDNFVYTVEGMQNAYARVKPDGMLVVTFELYEPWIGQRINGMLEKATGQKPVVIHAHHGTVFLVRKGNPISTIEVDNALEQLHQQAELVSVETGNVPLTTDDWPYLYMSDREIPFAYLSILPLLGLIAVGMMRRFGLGFGQIRWRFFFLGAGFLLMEVRIIGQVALLFGSTWIVNVVAIAAILLMAVLANLMVAVRRFESVRPWGILLVVTLVLSSIIPADLYLNLGQGAGGTLAALVLALPVFFASVIFSISFRKTSAVDFALASNLGGAILGGFAEYVTLLTGIGSLAWVALVFYLAALASKD